MTDQSKPVLTDMDIANMRQNVNLLRSQLKAGRLDQDFLSRQIEKLSTLLERVESERQESKRYGRFEALYNVSRVLGSSLDLQTVLDQVMDAIIQLTTAERGFLMLQDDDGRLTVKAARNFDQQTLSSDNFNYSRTVANQILDSGSPILTTNAAEDPRFAGQASIVAQSLRSIMATPLRARGNVIGVAYVDSRALAGLFKPEDLDALDALSGQAAIAIDNAMLFNATDKELSARLEELRQLRRIDLLMNETLDPDKAMLYTLEWACRLSGATNGYLGLMEGQPPSLNIIHHYRVDSSSSDENQTDELKSEISRVLTTGNAVTRNGAQNSSSAVLIVPIRREQSVIGVVILNRESDEAFTGEQQDLVERVVARAAVAIENARLYAAVQVADMAKSEFVGIVAHDLKAPMNGIGGYSELLIMQGGLTEKQSEYLRKIKDTVRRMEILVSDLADISRIESGHFFMETNAIPVDDVIQAVKDGTMPQVQERNHQFVEKIEPDLPEVMVDYYRLLQVLINLLSNAYKYTPDGGTITLDVRREGDRVRFIVSDTGIGLSEEGIAMLGTKFWRAEDRYTRSQPGTGLGFAITRHLVEQMGSTIDIKSKEGEGSSFSFTVPVA
jgi:signal transduction histidine kinase